MKRMSPRSRFVRMPIRSPPRSNAGPEVEMKFAPISLATTPATVVLPSPGGPCSRMWSTGSLRSFAAWMPMRAIDFLEQVLRVADAGVAPQRLVDHPFRLGLAVSQLPGEHFHDLGSEVLCRRRRRHLRLLQQGVLRPFAVQGGDNLFGRTLPDSGQPPQEVDVLALDGVGDDVHRVADGLHRFGRPHPVHGDEALEELLLHFAEEPDEEWPWLVGGDVVGDVKGNLALRRGEERPGNHRRQMHLVAHAAGLDHAHVLREPQNSPAEVGDHARASTGAGMTRSVTPRRERAVSASAAASAACWSGRARRSNSSATIACTCALPARPEPVSARFTAAEVRVSTGMSASAAAREITPRMWARSSAVRGNAWWANKSSSTTSSGRCSWRIAAMFWYVSRRRWNRSGLVLWITPNSRTRQPWRSP